MQISKVILFYISMFSFSIKAQEKLIKNSTVADSEDKVYLSPNQYFLSNSAFMLKKKSIDYQNIYGLYNEFEYGVSNNFSVTGGIFINPSFRSLPFTVGLKYGKEVAENLSLFVYSKNLIISTEGVFAGIVGLGTTFGKPERNLTLGLNWGYSRNGFVPLPLLSIAASTKLSKKVFLVTDNYFIANASFYSSVKENVFVYSFGLKLAGKRQSFGLGALGINSVGVFPYLKGNFNLSKRK
jgi:hypothetical protein